MWFPSCLSIIRGTVVQRSERSAESPTLQSTNNSFCGNVPVLLHQQGRDGRDGRDGLQGPVGPLGMKGEKGDPGIQLQGSPGPQGMYVVSKATPKEICSYHSSHSSWSHTLHCNECMHTYEC